MSGDLALCNVGNGTSPLVGVAENVFSIPGSNNKFVPNNKLGGISLFRRCYPMCRPCLIMS